MEILAWAIQGGISIPCIERYLNKQSASNLEYQLGVALVTGLHTYPILYFAVERNAPQLVSILCSLGATTEERATPSDLPLLAYAAVVAEYEVIDTTSTLAALLAAGADPHDLPEELWKDYLRSPSRLQITPTTEPYNPLGWCTLELQDALCRNLNLMQRYFLWKAEKLPKQFPREKQVAKANKTTALLTIPYYIIGQSRATKAAVVAIMSHILVKRSEPLILLFAGPSGHGKTELAMRMGELLSLSSLTVDCAEMKHETDFFGPKAPYQGWEDGSPLNNYLAQWAGQSSVVFLDEFDKTTDEVRKSLLLVFQSGEYRDRRDRKCLDCSKTIWVLATNKGEECINQFWVDNLKDRTEEQQNDAPFGDLRVSLKRSIMSNIGKPLTGRISQFIPFFPFTEGEQAVVAYKFLRGLSNDVRGPINVEAREFARHLYLNFIDDGKIAQCLAKESYDNELGARSLKTAADSQVMQSLSEKFLCHSELITNEMNNGPLAKYDVRVSTSSTGFEEVTVTEAGSTTLQRRKSGKSGTAK